MALLQPIAQDENPSALLRQWALLIFAGMHEAQKRDVGGRVMSFRAVSRPSVLSESYFIGDLQSLFTRYGVRFGETKDLEHFRADLDASDAFRVGLFQLCTAISHMSERDLTPEELLNLVAWAMSGAGAETGKGEIGIPAKMRETFVESYEIWTHDEPEVEEMPPFEAVAASESQSQHPAVGAPSPVGISDHPRTHIHTLLQELEAARQQASRDVPGRASSDIDSALARLTVSSMELKMFLEDIELRMSRIEPHLEQINAMVHSSAEYFDQLEKARGEIAQDGSADMPPAEKESPSALLEAATVRMPPVVVPPVSPAPIDAKPAPPTTAGMVIPASPANHQAGADLSPAGGISEALEAANYPRSLWAGAAPHDQPELPPFPHTLWTALAAAAPVSPFAPRVDAADTVEAGAVEQQGLVDPGKGKAPSPSGRLNVEPMIARSEDLPAFPSVLWAPAKAGDAPTPRAVEVSKRQGLPSDSIRPEKSLIAAQTLEDAQVRRLRRTVGVLAVLLVAITLLGGALGYEYYNGRTTAAGWRAKAGKMVGLNNGASASPTKDAAVAPQTAVLLTGKAAGTASFRHQQVRGSGQASPRFGAQTGGRPDTSTGGSTELAQPEAKSVGDGAVTRAAAGTTGGNAEGGGVQIGTQASVANSAATKAPAMAWPTSQPATAENLPVAAGKRRPEAMTLAGESRPSEVPAIIPVFKEQLPKLVPATTPLVAAAKSSEAGTAAIPVVRVPQEAKGPVYVPSSAMLKYAVAMPKPAYPRSLGYVRDGTVVVEATISSNGSVRNARAFSGPNELRPAVLQAIREWKFKPYLMNNKPVEVVTTFNFEFRRQ